MAQQKPTLGYWAIRGLGNPVRFLINYLEIDYNEKLYGTAEHPKEKWTEDKESLGLPFPNLPYLLDGENKITESRAIMKYLCRTHKPELLGKNAEIQTKLDMVDNFIYDLMYSGLVPVVYQHTEDLIEQYKESEPRKLGYLVDFIKDNQWCTGNDLTYADFFVYEVLYQLTVYNSKCLDKFPKLKEYMKRFEELPAIKKYMNSPAFIKAPVYSDAAVYKM